MLLFCSVSPSKMRYKKDCTSCVEAVLETRCGASYPCAAVVPPVLLDRAEKSEFFFKFTSTWLVIHR